MFNRKDVQVRPLSEELVELGLDPDKVMSDIERVSGKLIEGGSPLPGNAHLVEDTDTDADAADTDDASEVDIDDAVEMFFDDDDDDDIEEGYRAKRTGFKDVGGKQVRVTKAEKQSAKVKRRRKKGVTKTAGKKYRQRFKTKIAKRRKLLKGRGKARKGFRRVQNSFSQELANLREDLENSGAVNTEPSPYEEAAVNAGYLALLLGEIFESVGDIEAGGMLRTMSDSAADLSEAIESNGGDINEDTEAKLTSLLEGVSKAMEAHENIGEPGLFEAIEIGFENGVYEDSDFDDDLDELDEGAVIVVDGDDEDDDDE